MNDIDVFTVWVIVLPTIYLLGFLTQTFVQARLYSAALCCFSMGVFIGRLGVLRLANAGETPLLSRAENSFVINALSSAECYSIVNILFSVTLFSFIWESQRRKKEMERML